jgi:hypothetical protein
VACLALGGGGVGDLLRIEDLKVIIDNLGYPLYLLTLLGVLKILGVVAVLAPGFGRLKEWAYAGFTFDLVGAFYSHVMVKDPIADTVPPLIILVIVLTSYFLRPDSRKLGA